MIENVTEEIDYIGVNIRDFLIRNKKNGIVLIKEEENVELAAAIMTKFLEKTKLKITILDSACPNNNKYEKWAYFKTEAQNKNYLIVSTLTKEDYFLGNYTNGVQDNYDILLFKEYFYSDLKLMAQELGINLKEKNEMAEKLNMCNCDIENYIIKDLDELDCNETDLIDRTILIRLFLSQRKRKQFPHVLFPLKDLKEQNLENS